MPAMTAERAAQITGFTDPTTAPHRAEEIQRLAISRRNRLAPGTPLRYQVALDVIIDACESNED